VVPGRDAGIGADWLSNAGKAVKAVAEGDDWLSVARHAEVIPAEPAHPSSAPCRRLAATPSKKEGGVRNEFQEDGALGPSLLAKSGRSVGRHAANASGH
jgi:hypothetical protein